MNVRSTLTDEAKRLRRRERRAANNGKIYWLHVLDSGVEVFFSRQPTRVKFLRVEIVRRNNTTLVERTWTRTGRAPKGEGWQRVGYGMGSEIFERTRSTKGEVK